MQRLAGVFLSTVLLLAMATMAACSPSQGSTPSTASEGGISVSCQYGSQLTCSATFANSENQTVNYFWSVNGVTVNSGHANGALIAHTHDITSAGEYVVEASVKFPDGTWHSATTTTVVATLAVAEGGGAPTVDPCPGGVNLMGVCVDK